MKLFCLMIPLLLLFSLPCIAAKKQSFTLWQLPEQTHSQMMSYVIRTLNGKVIVIDGGMPGDAPYLKGFLAALGNRVDVWFISHLHDDHFGAITEILKKPGDLQIGRLYASDLDDKWLKEYVSEDEYNAILSFNSALGAAGRKFINVKLGQTMNVDGVKIEVLGISNPEIHANPLNNSSLVLRVWDTTKSMLFLGDLGPEGGEKLLRSKYASHLHADYVQMAHHGQNGVDLSVYKAIQPTYCLWPTPDWLWDNNIGGKGKGTGPWKTLEVRKWMEDFHIKQNFVSTNGIVRID